MSSAIVGASRPQQVDDNVAASGVLLPQDALDDIERQLQNLDTDHRARSVDGVHDLLLRLGDLSVEEIAARSRIDAADALRELLHARRAVAVNISGEPRAIPVEYAGRYRDALGVPLPVGLPESLLAPAPQASQDLARRYARTHGPFSTGDFAARTAIRSELSPLTSRSPNLIRR